MRQLRSSAEPFEYQSLTGIKSELEINNEIAKARGTIYSLLKRRKLNEDQGLTEDKKEEEIEQCKIQYENQKKKIKSNISSFLGIKAKTIKGYNFVDDFEDDIFPRILSSSPIESSEMQEYNKRCKSYGGSDCDYFDEYDAKTDNNIDLYWTDAKTDNNIDRTDIIYNFSLVDQESFLNTRVVDEAIDISKR
jgi:hypothetical protein